MKSSTLKSCKNSKLTNLTINKTLKLDTLTILSLQNIKPVYKHKNYQQNQTYPTNHIVKIVNQKPMFKKYFKNKNFLSNP